MAEEKENETKPSNGQTQEPTADNGGTESNNSKVEQSSNSKVEEPNNSKVEELPKDAKKDDDPLEFKAAPLLLPKDDTKAEKEEKSLTEFNDDAKLTNISEAEGQVKKMPYPKSVFFIISNEFCERFNYYGMRTILVLYLNRELNYSDDTSTVIFHVFTMFVYFLCVFGAIVSDSWLGKFKTILYLSIVYVCGSILVTLGAVPPLNLPATTFTMIGLSLIALGSGGIKPCVSAFGGDQFKLPEQVKQMTTFFSLFYFSINAGSLISTFVTPILRQDVHCFNERQCYSLAFGVPAALMLTSIIVFVLGRPLYKVKPPAGNMVVLVSKTIGHAIANKWREKKTNPREHWLDYADDKYDRQMIDDVKVLMRVLVLYLPLPFFWALFDQQGSRWTFQATRMNGDMGGWDIKPDQMQVVNPLLILVFIPLYDVAFYPALSLIGIRRPLQKLTMGGILAGIAFVLSAIVELQLEHTYPVLPGGGIAQLRVFNGENCDYTVNTNITGLASFDVGNLDAFTYKDILVNDTTFYAEFTFTPKDSNCYPFEKKTYEMKERTAYSLFLSSVNSEPIWYEDFVNKPTKGDPYARTLINVNGVSIVKWRRTGKDAVVHEEPAYLRNSTELSSGEYKIFIDEVDAYTITLKTGGVYSIIINKDSAGAYDGNTIEVTDPNSMNIFWLIPQYVVMTLGEVMFSVTGLEFSYSQAPLAMKSVLQACWLLTVAFGNVIVIIIAELSLFDSQAYEFFLFAGLMFLDMIVFMFVAYRYKPNNPVPDSETEPLNAPEDEKNDDPKGIDNVANTIAE